MVEPAADEMAEAVLVRERYARRATRDPRYSLLNAAALMSTQERERAMVRLFARLQLAEFDELQLVEVGSGDGSNLLELLRLGFAPYHLSGVELLRERHDSARERLPDAIELVHGDATVTPFATDGFDIVLASTVFSSLLDDTFQHRLADAMWRWVKPGGGVLWYDFTVDNPRNPDVRGVPLSRVRALFPHGQLRAQRVTLAPPIARRVTRVHPSLYTLFNAIPLLRTHVLAWIAKPSIS